MHGVTTKSGSGLTIQFAILIVICFALSSLVTACGGGEDETPTLADKSIAPTATLAPPTATIVPTTEASPLSAASLKNIVYAKVVGMTTRLDVCVPEVEIRLIHGIDIDSAWYDIPPEVSEELYQALLDAGYDVELTLVEDSPRRALTATGSDGFNITVEQVIKLAGD